MHHVYQTRGFVFGSTNFGEANSVFKVFTKDLGLVRASAQGVRFLKSKLRYSLHDFSYCEISLVRGKEQWRIVGAQKIFSIRDQFLNSIPVFQIFVRVFLLLDRLLSGEEKNESLFSHIEEAVLHLKDNSLEGELVRNFEYILVLRILHCLGYLGSSPDTDAFVLSPYWNTELLEKMSHSNAKILQEINKSIKESQL